MVACEAPEVVLLLFCRGVPADGVPLEVLRWRVDRFVVGWSTEEIDNVLQNVADLT